MIFVEKNNLNTIIRGGSFYGNISFGVNATRDEFIAQGLYELIDESMPSIDEYQGLTVSIVTDEKTKTITRKYNIIDLTIDDEDLLKSKLKKEGKIYTLNGVDYMVPLDKDAQDIVSALTTQCLSNMLLNDASLQINTIINFSNGVDMPITQNDWVAFASWFVNNRNEFFIPQTN